MQRSSATVMMWTAACLAMLALTATRVAAGPGLAGIWAVDDGEKVFQDDLAHPLKAGGGDNSVWDGATVRLFAARNEIVAFQLILEADGGGADAVNVVVSDLSNGADTIPGSHPLPGPNDYLAVGVELFTEHYLHVEQYSYNDPVWGGFYTTAEANPQITGWIPDALVPFSAAVGKGGAPFDIPANTNQGVWVDIYVARDLPPGMYTGAIQISVGGALEAEIPLELEVLDAVLPDQNHYRSMLFYSDYCIRPRHNLSWGSDLWQMLGHYQRMAHRHRLELIGAGTWDEIANLGGTITGDIFTAPHGYAGPGEGVGNTLFSIHTYGCWFDDNETAYRAESDAWVNWFDANAPDVEYFLYLTDEPGPDMYDWIAERAGWIHDNPGSGHRLPVFITRAPIPDLIGSIDIWCTQAPWYEPAAVEAARARGERVWVYAGNRPQTPMDVMDEYGVALRLKPWIAYKCDVRRWFTWETSHWDPNRNEVPNDVLKNPWADPLTFYAGYDGSRGNGDGTLFYPGEDYVFPDENREYPGPISSIRMKMYRRGIQDYEYMWMAEELGYGDQVAAMLDDLLPHVMWDAVTVPDWSNRNATYEAARREMGYLIDGRMPFADVGPDHWAFAQVGACHEAGIVAGYEDGLYHPELSVTRDQMAVYIARALAGGEGSVPAFTGTPTFPDVSEGFWALDHVEYAVDQAVVAGYEDGHYHPEYEVTRDQMAVYVARALVAPTGEAALEGFVPSDPRDFPDVPSDFWAWTHVEYCAENGVVQGYGDGLYHPERAVTRDQMAVYIARAFDLTP